MPGGSTNSSGGRRRYNSGRWTREEHEQFLGGLEAVGEVWCLLATYVPSRTELQIRTHAQKYFRKVRQGLPFPEEPYQSAGNGNDGGAGAHIGGGAAAAGSGAASGPQDPTPPAAPRHWVPGLGSYFAGPDSAGRNLSWAAIRGEYHYSGSAPPAVPAAASAPPLRNPNAACLSNNLDGVSHNYELGHGAPAFMEQQQQQYLPPWEGHGAGIAGGRFSPPHGEAAPFRNWPVAEDDLQATMLSGYDLDNMDAPNNNDDGEGDGDAAAAGPAAAALHFR